MRLRFRKLARPTPEADRQVLTQDEQWVLDQYRRARACRFADLQISIQSWEAAQDPTRAGTHSRIGRRNNRGRRDLPDGWALPASRIVG